jgi:hypothetical protein
MGGTYKPPIMQADNLRLVDWIPDVFPDLLWVAGFLAHADDPDQAMLTMQKALGIVMQAAEPAPGSVCDGHLTALERVGRDKRTKVIEALIDAGMYADVVSEEWFHAISCYPNAPGFWLVDPYVRRGLIPDRLRGVGFIRRTIEACPDGQTRVATNAKAAVFATQIQSGTIRFARNERISAYIDELTRYPHGLSAEDRLAVDAQIRASYGGVRDLGPDRVDVVEWAKTFWRTNWTLTPCERGGEVVLDDANERSTGGTDASRHPDDAAVASIRSAVESAVAEATRLHGAYLEASTTADPDLYSPDRYEVLTGITGRTLRELTQLLGTPVPWSAHGQHLLRVVVEALMLVRYLSKHDEEALYRKFKTYGRGKLKLLKLRWDEYVDGLDDPPAELLDFVEALTVEVIADTREEFQDIDFGSNPLGKPLRKLAEAIGMTDDYDLVLAPASNALHGDWTTLDRHALERCLNPLHRWHRIPRLKLGWQAAPHLVGQLLDYADELVAAYVEAIQQDCSFDRESSVR